MWRNVWINLTLGRLAPAGLARFLAAPESEAGGLLYILRMWDIGALPLIPNLA